MLTSFKDVTLYALQGNSKVHQFQDIREHHIRNIFKWDILNLRQRLPKRLLQFSFDVGGQLLKSFISITSRDVMYAITVSDFQITEKQLNRGLDLIGICRVPLDT